ncbi:EamA family transporter [Rhodoferax lacus]|uniref:EamA family transporter n=1 Tax=Rhodoferax lacus TaxID=2184758 RepID=A0A3E1RF99_9BURK|nr:DMT family transporter [Rhodoferax lacus]RFO98056.1 EamA family transporter [Rhodoferax lacus]
MPISALALVVLAGLIHALWNIAAKKANGDVRYACFIALFTVLVWAPVGLYLAWQQLPQWDVAAWACVVASGLIHVLYFIVLLRGYREADLTVVYPLARGSGPLISSLVAVVLFGEHISVYGFAGLAAVVLGVFLVAGGTGIWHNAHSPEQRSRIHRGLFYGLLTGFCIASYTLVDGYSVKVLLLSPILMFYMACCVQALLLLAPVVQDRALARQHWQQQWKSALLVGALSPVSYVLVLYALQIAPISHVAPAREVSMLFAALLGGHLLREGDRLARMMGAACIGLGVVALSLG